MGTGFAQPNITGEWLRSKIMGKSIVPKGSMWARGFKVSRPAYFAVLSPSQYAVNPCEYSWITTASKNMTKERIKATFKSRLFILPA